MHRKILCVILALLLCVSSAFSIMGCNGSQGNTNETISDFGTDTQETEAPTEKNDGDETEITDRPTNTEETGADLYGNGDLIDIAGFDWDKDAFALKDYDFDTSSAIEISASGLSALLNAETIAEGTVYRVTEPLVLETTKSYDGNFSHIIAEKGVLIKDASEIVIRELVIEGDIKVESSSSIVFFNVDIRGGSTAVELDNNSSSVSFKGCKITADDVAVKTSAKTVTFFETKLTADKGIISDGDETAVHGCHFINLSGAVVSRGKSCIVRNSTIEVSADCIAIDIENGYNGLVALNRIVNSQSSISIKNSFNCSVILNSAVCITAHDNTNLYVVDNKLGGILELKNNNYLISDGNAFANDGKDHTIIDIDNTNLNGSDLTDVNARADVGANEEILPHTNKELFVGMERRTKVLDASFTKQYSLNQYIRNNSKAGSVVIVPPGAYASSSAISLGSTHGNTTVYAYGAYEECTKLDVLFAISSATNIEMRGLTMGYTELSGGQMDILKKMGSNQFITIPSAGWGSDFGKSNSSTYSTGFTEVYTDDDLYPWAVIGSYYSLSKNDNGTMSLTINDASMAKGTYAGDTMTCRYAGENKSSVKLTDSTNIKFLDCVLYGFSNALAVVASGATQGVKLERFHNTTQPNPIIDKETYDRYIALEEEYGVDLEIYIDADGRYRGATPRQGSTDATHIIGTIEGVDVTSSIFEGMTDDGSNQRSSSSRLHKIEINGNTATIYYKGLMAKAYEGKSTGSCSAFAVGDRIRVYAINGGILCDTNVLGATVATDEIVSIAGTSITTKVYKVTVSAASIDKEVLELINTTYDLSDNSSSLTNRVVVDNISRNSAGFTFDNVMIRNTRSRGILVKTVGVTIKHCTFQNLAHTGLVIAAESEWGESTAAQDIVVKKCIFDNTGAVCNYTNRTDLCPIWIGTGNSTVAENALPYKNITIDGCVFMNNKSRYAITINSAQNVKVTNNTFGEVVGERYPSNIATSVLIDRSMNIEISDNTYSPNLKDQSVTKAIKASNYINIYGTDVVNADGTKLFANDLK